MSENPIPAQSFITGKPPLATVRSFLLIGSEQFLMDKVNTFLYKEIRARFDTEIEVVWADELKAYELRDYLESYSLFAESKVLFIKNADQMKEEVIKPLAEYYSSPSDDLKLIISAVSVDQRISAWKTVIANSMLIECKPPKYPSDLGKWLDSEIRSMKLTITPDARQFFLERVELDYKSADNELQKIYLYIRNKNRIDRTDVAEVLGSTRANTVNEIYNALHTQKPGKVMAVIQNILDTGGDAIPTLASIHRFYMNLWHIALLKTKKKLSPTEISQPYLKDLREFHRNAYLKSSEHYPLEVFEAIFDILLDTDAKLKLTAADQKTLMALCIGRIFDL